ncbi:conserved protein of unknown function [Tepidanaerobacter acetatoxydans Re1]|uniref:Polysaccharide pyruvyl transferase domain-containing protein n=1 Tax=Tepidanaerobacter acetatoxydans (strain DSM 21804 / JCM 16047 / Re1) TaxID=1209989 RepID=F4LX95_TEPAE|nr:polysaccharide pyruvyl transferase family protein [Tepidanaerobacter acetatoxydans]AEE91894.1 hypothetical protein TepRe1_1763 [Tepidanaerobacter acetatoxydans Re1]CCP26714.1 conserved protein of unknown function [Tepidanaerobacter acetatoxydans Re1]
MVKKIGIVTWYDRGYNYGSTLQAYASQIILQKMGYSSEFINFNPERQKISKRIKEILKRIYLYLFDRNVYETWKKMDDWIKSHLIISEKYDSYEQLKSKSLKYDAVICGSDQIWNNSSGEINPFYYLQFINESKRIAYAPSIARDYIDKNLQSVFCDYVKGIKYLSIRETQGAELIKNITGRDAKVVLDPTLLVDKHEWENKLSDDYELKNKMYIFCYLLTKNDKHYKIIAELSNKLNIEVITPTLLNRYDKTSKNVDFFEFLNLIRYADYVVTDSFHGVAFSLNFCKQFAVFKRFPDSYKETQNSRIYSILNEFGLNDRLVTDNNSLELIIKKNINYEDINIKLKRKREDSLQYLRSSLESAIKSNEENL